MHSGYMTDIPLSSQPSIGLVKVKPNESYNPSPLTTDSFSHLEPREITPSVEFNALIAASTSPAKFVIW